MLTGAELANTYADMDDLDLALQSAKLSAERAEELDQAYMIATAQDALAYVHELRGEWQDAQAVREVTIEAAVGTDNRLIPMVNGPGLAEALLEAKQVDDADELVQEVLQISERARYPVVAARAIRVMARIHAHRDETEKAAEAFAEALRLCEEWNSQMLAGRILLDWAALESAQGSTDPAASKLERALEIFESTGAKYWLDRTQAALDELAQEGASQES